MDPCFPFAARFARLMGFGSAGRFRVEYRKHFHESLSETLSRRRVAVAR
ncbi:hypothetical protein [Polyangium sp. 6x1]|nr:hypothetical protein [Polyangium sp. 6x1]MDI1447996.1 hypothetical protein [Polyangium sp. 6x1]